MAEHTEISWTDATFNPWLGCQKISPACDNCYAEMWSRRTGQAHLWQGERRRTSDAYWRQPLRWNAKAEREGRRLRVFCASLADVFDNQVPLGWRQQLMGLIACTPHLDWLLLTKRPQNIAKMVDALPANVWLGTTAENQDELDRRLPPLAAMSARIRFLSCEPLLGPLTLSTAQLMALDWIICGGESGPKARPMSPEWARSLRDQCQTAGVFFHFKQWGGRTPKAGGRLLDGREWNEVPRAALTPETPA